VAATYLIGLDFGTESARGVLVDASSGEAVASHVHAYRHGVMTRQLAGGAPLPWGWALQDASDYTEAAAEILGALGRGRLVASIGVDFTASSPLPTGEDGRPLSQMLPDEPHAYVKLWKHRAAQPHADAINARGGEFLDNFGGRLSGEWLLAKAAQLAEEAPRVWAATARFIEAGDWLVWQLTGREARSLGFAAYKAQYTPAAGYPRDLVPGLESRLAPPEPIGSAAGSLAPAWRERTGIQGPAVVAVAVIDSHALLPAVGAVRSGCLVGALGTSAVYLFLADAFRPLPAGIEGVARDGSIRGLWCYEAGQASFGDLLAWFVSAFGASEDPAQCFRDHNEAAAAIAPGSSRLLALDWWSGNRVPHADSGLSGLLLGLGMETTAAQLYRALMESVCCGARSIVDRFAEAGFPVEDRLIVASGLAQSNPLLVQILADVLGRAVYVPSMAHATAVGAAIHGAVAAGVAPDYAEGAARFGARTAVTFPPRPEHAVAYEALYREYAALAGSAELRRAMHGLNAIRAEAARRAGPADLEKV
jgi:L-ribulokinase